MTGYYIYMEGGSVYMEFINKSKYKIIVPVVLGFGLLFGLGFWSYNQLEKEELKTQKEVIQEKQVVTPPTSENTSSNTTGVIGHEDGLKYGEGWVETAEWEQTEDPNRVLSSGVSLWEAKKMVEADRKAFKDAGFSDSQIKSEIDTTLKALGTTEEELNRCPDRDLTTITQDYTQQQPAEKKQNTGQKPSTVQPPAQQQSSGSYLPPSVDKDRNGLNDAFEEVGQPEGAVVTTTSDPNFKLGTPE